MVGTFKAEPAELLSSSGGIQRGQPGRLRVAAVSSESIEGLGAFSKSLSVP